MTKGEKKHLLEVEKKTGKAGKTGDNKGKKGCCKTGAKGDGKKGCCGGKK